MSPNMSVHKFVRVGDYEYDITNFKHPGGNVIFYMTQGQDATNVFEEFHYRSTRAKSVLQSLPKTKRETPPAVDTSHDDRDSVLAAHATTMPNEHNQAILADFKLFRRSLEMRGFFKPSRCHIAYRIFELMLIFGIAVNMIAINTFASVVLFGLFGGRCGWIQHEGGHHSLTGHIKTDKWIQNLFIGVGLLTDGSQWNSMHNKHHATPQKVDHDLDLSTAPLVAFYTEAARVYQSSWIARSWLRFQCLTFLPVTSGAMVMLFWIVYLHPRRIIHDRNWRQACVVMFGHASRIGLFMHLGGASLVGAFWLHFLSFYLSGIYLFGHFSLSHTFTPVVQSDENPSWVHYAIEHTVDISPQNRAVSWIMGYLNCQVIHHLFPSMPQYRGPEVSTELQAFCDKWAMQYTVIGYFEARYLMFKNLHDVGCRICDTKAH